MKKTGSSDRTKPPAAQSGRGRVAKLSPEIFLDVDAAEVAGMLRQARAPEPWKQPDLCGRVAGRMNVMARWIRHATVNDSRSYFDRAQDAVDELRRTLPKLIAAHATLEVPSIRGATEVEEQQYKEALNARGQSWQNLQDALVDFTPREKGKTALSLKQWQSRAFSLWQGYGLIVGIAPLTRNGPAVRFVRAALVRIGDRSIMPGTVEQALRRLDTNPP